MPGDHFVDAARAIFGGAGEHFHPAPLQAPEVGRGFVPPLALSHHRDSHPQAGRLRSLRDVSHEAVEVIETDALGIDDQMNAPAWLISPADTKSGILIGLNRGRQVETHNVILKRAELSIEHIGLGRNA